MREPVGRCVGPALILSYAPLNLQGRIGAALAYGLGFYIYDLRSIKSEAQETLAKQENAAGTRVDVVEATGCDLNHPEVLHLMKKGGLQAGQACKLWNDMHTSGSAFKFGLNDLTGMTAKNPDAVDRDITEGVAMHIWNDPMFRKYHTEAF